jgi:type VI secretion system protein ImpK
MPITPRPSAIDPDTDPFATHLEVRRAAPAKASASPDAGATSGPNALISEADALLALVPQLRSTPHIADVARLRTEIVALLQRFDERTRARGVTAFQTQKAHFVLCALIDEVVEAMPWGAAGQWQRLNPLQASVGTRPGEGAVRQLAQMAEDPGTNRDLRELVFAALALGFDARGRGAATAGAEADQIRARVAGLLSREPSADERALSVRWKPAVGRGNALASWLPLWVGSFIIAGLLAVLYFALALALGSQSDRVFAQIAALRFPTLPTMHAASAAAEPRLAPLLAASGALGLQVRDEIDRSVVTLRDDALFEPATANLLSAADQVLRPVAAALQQASGQIQVIGHTDSQFERSARFPSNWELSVERARAVRDALRALGISEARLHYDGRADTEPLAAAGAGQTAARNGRVEIVLLAGR